MSLLSGSDTEAAAATVDHTASISNHETTINAEKDARTISWAKHLQQQQQQHADTLQ
jgi:hypothetical protein